MLIAGNWKMFKGAHQAREFAAQIRRLGDRSSGVEIVVCPPFVSLEATIQGLGEGSSVMVYAQNVHWELEGAFTGEVSAPMLLELGVKGALVGHSERRQHFGETDETVRLRAEAALEAGLSVIACVGETEAERDAEEIENVLERQVSALPRHERLVIAYEPVWAIGTGRTATPEVAEEAHAHIKSLHPTRVLYGGSVNADNARVLLSQPDVDGALVGGASLDAQSFEAICLAGCRSRGRVSDLVALVILDGWGLAPPGPGNAVELADTPVFDALWERYPHAVLRASGEAVGLPPVRWATRRWGTSRSALDGCSFRI